MRNLHLNPFDDDDMNDMDYEGRQERKYTEPKEWTLVSAMDRILNQSGKSGLCDEFWDECKNPIDYLTDKLELTKAQVVFLAILIESGETMSWRMFGKFLGCTRLSVMVYSEELDDLVVKGWIMRRLKRELNGPNEGFALMPGVITAMRNNKKFIPERIDGLSEQEFMDRLERHIDRNLSDNNIDYSDDEEWMVRLCEANPQLPICKKTLSLKDIHDRSLLLMIAFDYAQWADSDDEGLTINTIDHLYPEDYECHGLRHKLKNGSHILIKRGLIEHKCEDGMADTDRYMLTRRAKEELLSAYKPSKSKVRAPQNNNRLLRRHTTITEKTLFYNEADQAQIERLTSMLSQENLPAIQQRLQEQGMRKGFACLFYGAPGTGKTETVLQIARQTGRDIMQIDIAGLRDKWVGESEKNIKAVFSRYRDICRHSDVMPILFFNEADGIINKRNENVTQSVDKMDNAMQNIILQEIEDLDGILIATTNLTSNLDTAFERRFIFKIEFHMPDIDVKTKIWSSMLTGLSDDDAHTLAAKFDFSGGQIENIARKRTIDYILSGEYSSIEGIEGYCRNELLAGKGKMPAVGFR